MKRKIVLLLIGCIIISCLCGSISAANSDSYDLYRWTNILSVEGRISFDGTDGNYSMVITGVSDVSKITATAKLYYKSANGNWVEDPKNWTYSVDDYELIVDEDFKGVKGRDYKVIIDASVYRKGSSEKVTKTSTGTCS